MSAARAHGAPPTIWNNRIVDHAEVNPATIAAHPRNWRAHPKHQQAALKGAIDQIGFTRSVTVNRRTGFLIDGHLRVALALQEHQPTIAVEYVDLSPDEEIAALLTTDPIAALAVGDPAALQSLLADVSTTDEALRAMLDQLAASAAAATDSLAPIRVARASLLERFIVPPFSVLDARQGYWQTRKHAWISLGIQSELGRGEGIETALSRDSDWRPHVDDAESAGTILPGRRTGFSPAMNSGVDLGQTIGTTDTTPGGTDGPRSVYGSGSEYPGTRGGKRLTWVAGDRSVTDLDDTSRKNLAAGRRTGQRANATPSGSPRPATSLGPDGHTQRGDGVGRPLRATPHAVDPHGGSYTNQMTHGVRMGARPDHGPNVTRNPDGTLNYQPTNAENGTAAGTSIFDPVLVELLVRWFTPPHGHILDPFAGGSVRGVVSALLGRDYTGIDLSARQIAANQTQWTDVSTAYVAAQPPDQPAPTLGTPRWLVGDGQDAPTLAPGTYDSLLTCPPYASLERYSDDPRDLSTMPYADFLAAYRRIIAACAAMLAPDRFASIVVGDIRDPHGAYRGFVADTLDAFRDAGLSFYNDAILVTAVGSLPIRVGIQFEGARKLGKSHQNVLVFVKGDPKKATAAIGPVPAGDPFTPTDSIPLPE